MRIIDDIKLDFEDVLIKPQRSATASRKEVDITRTFRFRNSNQEWAGVPIFAANMDTTGTFAMADTLDKYDMGTCLHKYYSVDRLCEFIKQRTNSHHFFYTLGIGKKDREKLNQVAAFVPINNICIDVANGYTDYFVNRVAEIRAQFPKAILMVGNVCSPEMVQELILQGGADIIKIGIGPGSVCTTRLIAGIGYPQLSAVIECADAAHGLNAHICADGGCKTPGDVVKAFGAGSDFVMLGGILAGTDECEGEWEWENDLEWVNSNDGGFTAGKFKVDPNGKLLQKKKSLKFYGMSSVSAMDKHNGGVADYRASEGEVKKVSYKGPVKDTIHQILGGIRSACAYVGAKTLKDFSKRTTFIKVNRVK
jgi:GMP reductase